MSFVTHAPPFSLRVGGRYGFCGLGGEHQDPLDAITQADAGGGKGSEDLGRRDLGRGAGGQWGCFGVARRVDFLAP